MKIEPNKIEAKESTYLYVGESQLANSGSGLYSAISIYKEEIIAIFKGKILTPTRIKLRAKKNNDKYFISMLDGTIMDSMNTKCFAKYANDAQGFSHSTFKNNARIEVNINEKVCLIASRNIQIGEEIFCGYGRRYWKNQTLFEEKI